MSNKSYYFYPKHGNVNIFYGKFGVVRKVETFYARIILSLQSARYAKRVFMNITIESNRKKEEEPQEKLF